MAINKINSTTNNIALATGETFKKAEGATPLSKTDDAKFSAAAASLAANSAPDSNVAKIASLRAQIANGTYKPNASAIAGKLLQEAWLMNHN